MDDYVGTLVGENYVGAGFVAGGNVGGFADAVNHADD
jgi:hypothetical protein